jgi:hypothetical protein
MKNFYSICILLCFVTYNLKSVDFDLNGYVYNLPVVQKFPEIFSQITGEPIKEEYIYSDITRVRIRPSLMQHENSEFVLNYEINSLLSNVTYPMSLGDDISNRQAIDLKTQIYNSAHLQINHFIDRLYWRQFFDFGELTLGRQRISWGVGRVWQLTDLFNPINPANFTQFEKDGADALSGKIYTGNFSDLEFVVNFREIMNDYNYGLRYRNKFGVYDISSIIGFFDHRYILGYEIAGNLYGAGIRSEFLLSAKEQNLESNFYKILIGIDYQFNDKLYGMLEYKHNGRGSDCTLCYDMQSLFEGEILNVGLDYLASQITYQFHPLLSGNILNIQNIRDESGLLSVGLDYNMLQNLNIGLSGILFYGKALTEYSYYSNAGMMKIEWYF